MIEHSSDIFRGFVVELPVRQNLSSLIIIMNTANIARPAMIIEGPLIKPLEIEIMSSM